MRRLRFLGVVCAILTACGPTPPPIPPPVPIVVPADVAFRPVCTYSNGPMGWTGTLRASGSYRVKIFNGPNPPIVDYSNPKHPAFAVGADPNQVYVLVTRLPWVLEYLQSGRWYELSAVISTRPPLTCTI